MAKHKLTKSETARLSSAVRTWNKEVTKHNNQNPKSRVSTMSYNEAKDLIYSKKDYDRLMSALKRVRNKNAFNIVHESSKNDYVKITNVEYRFAKTLQNKVTARNEQRLDTLQKEREAKTIEYNVGGRTYTRTPNPSLEEETLIDYVKQPLLEKMINARDLTEKTQYFEDLLRLGFDYYDEKRATIYKDNVMKYVMPKYQNLDNYDVIMDYLKSLSPKQFYKKLKEYFESYNDFQPHYDLALTQAQFNKFGTEIGVKINTTIEPA